VTQVYPPHVEPTGHANMIYGYARVSTDAQDLTNQLAELKAAGCDPIFRGEITGGPMPSASRHNS
jgi:DNA invertase Pin-like site-specific DNA recombinase